MNLWDTIDVFYTFPETKILMDKEKLREIILKRNGTKVIVHGWVRELVWKTKGLGFVEVSLKPKK